MTNSEFILRLAEYAAQVPNVTTAQIKQYAEIVLKCLEKEQILLFPALGKLFAVKTDERITENPISHKRVLLPPRIEIVFESDTTLSVEDCAETISTLNVEGTEKKNILLFFSTLVEVLFIDRYLKINGWGTFKLIEDRQQQATNPTISFHSEIEWQKRLNKPFEHFESVVLNDGVSFEEEKIEEPFPPITRESTPVSVEENETTSSTYEEESVNEATTTHQIEEIASSMATPIPITQENKKNKWCTLLLAGIIGFGLGAMCTWLFLSPRETTSKNTLRSTPQQEVRKNIKSTSPTPNVQPIEQDSTTTLTDTIVAPTPSEESKEGIVQIKTPVKSEMPTDIVYVIVGELTKHTLQKGETMAKLAQKYYGNRFLWNYIARYNTQLKDPDNVPVGEVLKIPQLQPKK
ncbi:MAG: HU family DNA-binding protein [Phocaeicola sp.]|nr:HU family DNA-binding protein [Phocaeicola sp.]